jgi:diamine N-acetyltransferase
MPDTVYVLCLLTNPTDRYPIIKITSNFIPVDNHFMPLLESSRIRLRAPEPEDIQIIYEWENDQSLWQVSNTIAPVSRHLLRQYLKTAHLDIYQVRQLRLMIDLLGNPSIPAGTIDLFDFDPYHNRAGIGIMIDEQFRKLGLAGEAIDLICAYCTQHLGLHQLYCHITEDNSESQVLFKKRGFEISGYKKEWVRKGNEYKGVYFLQRILSGQSAGSLRTPPSEKDEEHGAV